MCPCWECGAKRVDSFGTHYNLIIVYRPKGDERDLIKRAGEAGGSQSMAMPYACPIAIIASCVAVGTHLLHQQLLMGLLHVDDVVIVISFCRFLCMRVPKGLTPVGPPKSLPILNLSILLKKRVASSQENNNNENSKISLYCSHRTVLSAHRYLISDMWVFMCFEKVLCLRCAPGYMPGMLYLYQFGFYFNSKSCSSGWWWGKCVT